MGTFGDMEDLATLMMLGGGVLAVYGLGSSFFSTREGEQGGLGIPLGLVGVGVFLLGLFLGSRWGVI